MILVVAEAADTRAVCVGEVLRRMGKRCLPIDLALLGRSLFLSQEVGCGSRLVDRASGVAVHVNEIKAIWRRRPGRLDVTGLVSEPHHEFAFREWRDCIWGWLGRLDALCVNPLAAQERAVKPLQLEAARRRAGGPRDLHQQRRGGSEAVRRALRRRPGSQDADAIEVDALGHEGLEPVEEHFLPDLAVTPTIVQQKVRGRGDVRATVIGDQVYCARIETPAAQVDSRLVDVMGYQRCTLLESVNGKLLALFARLGLVFGTVDFKEANSGELVFLEVKPQGQFLFVEIVTGLPLAAAFAEFLASRASQESGHPVT